MFNQTNKNVQSLQKYKLLAIYQKKQWEKHNVTKQISHAFFFTRVSLSITQQQHYVIFPHISE